MRKQLLGSHKIGLNAFARLPFLLYSFNSLAYLWVELALGQLNLLLDPHFPLYLLFEGLAAVRDTRGLAFGVLVGLAGGKVVRLDGLLGGVDIFFRAVLGHFCFFFVYAVTHSYFIELLSILIVQFGGKGMNLGNYTNQYG